VPSTKSRHGRRAAHSDCRDAEARCRCHAQQSRPGGPSSDATVVARQQRLGGDFALRGGSLVLTEGMPVIELLPRYPTLLGEEGQLHVEQFARNICNIHFSSSDRTVADAWARYWRQNWRISACEPEPIDALVPIENGDEEEVPSETRRGRPPPTVAQIRRDLMEAIDQLGGELRDRQHRIEIDTYDPTSDEVRLGLASRVFRLFHRIAGAPELWTNEMGPHVLRSMIDARIVIA
jgi:hypothetical protein